MPYLMENKGKTTNQPIHDSSIKHKTIPQKISLVEVLQGQSAIIAGFRGGTQFLTRIAEMGFQINQELTVLVSHNRGPLLIKVRETRIALGRRMAEKIMVTPK